MSHYIIRGGLAGRQRLRLLARVMRQATSGLLDRFGSLDGLSCLDVGCGGGDVTIELAQRLLPRGHVVGEDIDEIKLALARADAEALGLANVEFRCADVSTAPAGDRFDLIYVRFLLTHLPTPLASLQSLARRLRPGGLLVIEDIDFTGHVCYPEHPAFRRYHELHSESMKRRGGDPNIGPKLPSMLQAVGLVDIDLHVVQPMGLTGEVKLIPAMTMENIAEAVLSDGLATQDELNQVIEALYELANDQKTVTGMPRVFQTWGRLR